MAAWQDPQTFAIWLGMISAFILLLIAAIVLFTKQYYKRIVEEETKLIAAKLNYQRQLVKDSVKIQEQERERVSLELHDNLLSKLNTVLFGIRSDIKSFQIDDLLEECIGEVRQISHDLRPPLLEENSLAELLQRMLYPLQAQYNIEFNEQLHGDQALETTQKLQILRIAQEVLSNILKYANASSVRCVLRQTNAYSAMSIVDNGEGFDKRKRSEGLGFKNIELRAQILRGKYRVKSRLGEGTHFLLWMPAGSGKKIKQQNKLLDQVEI